VSIAAYSFALIFGAYGIWMVYSERAGVLSPYRTTGPMSSVQWWGVAYLFWAVDGLVGGTAFLPGFRDSAASGTALVVSTVACGLGWLLCCAISLLLFLGDKRHGSRRRPGSVSNG
jgi:hypothetical protein